MLYYVKSIDKNANVTFSAKLEPIKVFNQGDYERNIKSMREKLIFQNPSEFIGADNMGTYRSNGSDEGGISK